MESMIQIEQPTSMDALLQSKGIMDIGSMDIVDYKRLTSLQKEAFFMTTKQELSAQSLDAAADTVDVEFSCIVNNSLFDLDLILELSFGANQNNPTQINSQLWQILKSIQVTSRASLNIVPSSKQDGLYYLPICELARCGDNPNIVNRINQRLWTLQNDSGTTQGAKTIRFRLSDFFGKDSIFSKKIFVHNDQFDFKMTFQSNYNTAAGAAYTPYQHAANAATKQGAAQRTVTLNVYSNRYKIAGQLADQLYRQPQYFSCIQPYALTIQDKNAAGDSTNPQFNLLIQKSQYQAGIEGVSVVLPLAAADLYYQGELKVGTFGGASITALNEQQVLMPKNKTNLCTAISAKVGEDIVLNLTSEAQCRSYFEQNLSHIPLVNNENWYSIFISKDILEKYSERPYILMSFNITTSAAVSLAKVHAFVYGRYFYMVQNGVVKSIEALMV